MSRPEPRSPPADRLTRFSDRVKDYTRHRPSYPPAAIDAVLESLDPPQFLTIADIGAGTGISSRLLAERECTVHAIEPNDAMRRAGEAEAHPRIRWHPGTGECTSLPDRSVHLVTSFQAFHWLQHDRALSEFARILQSDGRLAICWNIRDDQDPFTKGYGQIILRHATEPPTSPAISGHERVPDALRTKWLRYRVVNVPNEQTHDLDGLIGRATSASYCPNAGAPLAALRSDLADLFSQYAAAGLVKLRYRTVIHIAHAPER